MKFIALATIVLFTLPALSSEKACRQVTVMRALSIVDRVSQTLEEIKDVHQLHQFVCNNINPTEDIFYPNGVKAYSKKAKDWFFPSNRFALLANGNGFVLYPNGLKAYSEMAKDWIYPKNSFAFLDKALKPGTQFPMFYPNGVKAFSEIAKDWVYPRNSFAALHKAFKKDHSENIFYPHGTLAYFKDHNNWYYPDKTFAFTDKGDPKLKTLLKLSGGKEIKLDFRGMRKLRLLFTLNRIDRLFGY